MQIDDQILSVTDIEPGYIIRFKDASKPNGPIRLKQGIVLEVDLSGAYDGAPVILSIQNDTQRGYYWQYFDPTATVNVVGFVNASYLDFRDNPTHYTT